tara:strand:+ start:356 stop:1012 length:657 start_codon:yes stop_codon:yes gene_type:complete
MTNAFWAVKQIHATHKWCLTGTPIQNQLDDLYSLVSFLGVTPWSEYHWWRKIIKVPYESGHPGAMQRVHAVLHPIMLARKKSSMGPDGQPLLQLKPYKERTVRLKFTEQERDFYDSLESGAKTTFNQFVSDGTVLSRYTHVLALLLKLRQCCDHPYLVLSHADNNLFPNMDKLAQTFFKNRNLSSTPSSSSSLPSSSISESYIKERLSVLQSTDGQVN